MSDKYAVKMLVLGIQSKILSEGFLGHIMDPDVPMSIISENLGISGWADDCSWALYNLDTTTILPAEAKEPMGPWFEIIQAVLNKAKAEGYHYVMFDQDGPVIEDWLHR